jgi:hypothetical protein
MDCFETIAATLLEFDGYWVRRSFKVNVTPQDKKRLGKNSMPRPEIDLLAFKPKEDLIIAFEAKSYLYSKGVQLAEITTPRETSEGRYKIFTCKKYRDIVIKQLKKDLIDMGMATKSTKIKLGLIAAKVEGGEDGSNQLAAFMRKHHWEFWRPATVKEKLEALADLDYENDVAVVASKILKVKK